MAVSPTAGERLLQSDDAFTASGEAEFLACRRLHGHALEVDAGNSRDVRAHAFAVRRDGSLATTVRSR